MSPDRHHSVGFALSSLAPSDVLSSAWCVVTGPSETETARGATVSRRMLRRAGPGVLLIPTVRCVVVLSGCVGRAKETDFDTEDLLGALVTGV